MAQAPCGPRPCRGLTITFRQTTLGRTSLEEWPARSRDLYLTTQNTHNKHPCLRRDSNPQSQQESGRRPTPQTARPLGSILLSFCIWIFKMTKRQKWPTQWINKQYKSFTLRYYYAHGEKIYVTYMHTYIHTISYRPTARSRVLINPYTKTTKPPCSAESKRSQDILFHLTGWTYTNHYYATEKFGKAQTLSILRRVGKFAKSVY
jgi:hypothetical protein